MLKFVSLAMLTLGAAGAAHAQTTDQPEWTGLYGGLQAGYGFNDVKRMDVTGTSTGTVNAITNGARPSTLSQNRRGFLGGAQVGFNLQRGRWVFGPEGDFSYMQTRGTTNSLNATTAGPLQNTVARNRLDWMGSARARIGYVLGDGFIYGTGGYAFGKVRGSAAFNSPTGAENYAGRDAYTAQGWIAGGGAEFRPFHDGMLSKVSFGPEVTYYDLGRSHIFANATTAANTGSYVIGRDTRGFNGVIKINYAFR
jgi:outer membrane immunogenic protein